MQFVWDKVPIILHGIKGNSSRSKEFMFLHPEAAENSKERLEQNFPRKKRKRRRRKEQKKGWGGGVIYMWHRAELRHRQ
jgi:hypothetical protein